MGGVISQNWLDDGEKYALLGMSLKYDERTITTGSLGPKLAILTRAAFKMPAHWRGWLGKRNHTPEALALQRPLPDDALRIVAKGERADGAVAESA